jgi:hypothetical protein
MSSPLDTLPQRSIHRPPTVKAAHLFLALECDRPLELPARYCLGGLVEVNIGRGAERSAVIENGRLQLRVSDARISSSHARLVRVGDTWVVEDRDSKNGTRVNGQPVRRAELADGDLLELGGTFLFFRSALAVPAGSPAILDGSELRAPSQGLATLGFALGVDMTRLVDIATSKIPVVVGGETGTGKEVVARAIHQLSERRGPFQALNCAALAPTMIESELFGWRKNAFAGALEDRPGLIAGADGGTLFLDEVGDLPLSAQGALLRVLQESEVMPIGATRPVKVDLRLVCATHHDLQALVSQGKFRADLFARIGGFSITLPPLHQRREDIGLIISVLLRKAAPGRADRITFSYEAGRALLRYSWPHNVRELEKCLAAAIVLAHDGTVMLEHLPEAVREQRVPPVAAPVAAPVAGPVPASGATTPGEASPPARMGVVAELRRRRVFRVMLGYGVACFAVLQIIEPVMHGLRLPDELLTYLVVALFLGFPLVAAMAWIYDINAGRIERTPPSRLPGLRGGRLALLLIVTSLVAASPGLAWYLLVHARSRDPFAGCVPARIAAGTAIRSAPRVDAAVEMTLPDSSEACALKEAGGFRRVRLRNGKTGYAEAASTTAVAP